MSKDEEDDAPQEVEKQADSSSGAAYWRVMALAAPWQGVPASQTEVKRLGGLLYTKCHVNQVNRGVCIEPMQRS